MSDQRQISFKVNKIEYALLSKALEYSRYSIKKFFLMLLDEYLISNEKNISKANQIRKDIRRQEIADLGYRVPLVELEKWFNEAEVELYKENTIDYIE